MVQIHPQARTTPAVRADIARATESAAVIIPFPLQDSLNWTIPG